MAKNVYRIISHCNVTNNQPTSLPNLRFTQPYVVLFRAYNHWAWVPIVACPLGGVLGAIVYVITIELHHTASAETEHPYEPLNTSDTAMATEEPL